MISESSLILVVSDSHGDVAALITAIKWVQNLTVNKVSGEPALNAAFFLGDGLSDVTTASAETGFTVPWHKVRGNGDYDFSIPGSLFLELPVNKRIDIPPRKCLLVHGNHHGVVAELQTLASAARNAGAEAAFFGHTHVPYNGVLDGVFLLNPGSLSRPRHNAAPTFAILECPPAGPLRARFFALAMHKREFTVRELELF